MKLHYSLILAVAFFATSLLTLQSNAQIVINEYSVSNLTDYLDSYNKSEDWIELYNTSSSTVDLSGYYLSDKPDNPTRWVIPDGVTIPANGFVSFWCSGRDQSTGTQHHTNFKLKQTKEENESVVFTGPDGIVIEEHELLKTQLGHSIGKPTDGTGFMKICTVPTKGSSNSSSSFYDAYAAKPEMDSTAGFYSSGITVTITTTETDATIHYTIDGSKPTSGAPVYSSPVVVSNTKIVKAIAVSDNPDILPSFIEFNTYFIDVDHELVILSTSADDLDELLNGDASLRPHGTFEYFDLDKVRTSFGYGEYNKHGQDSWAFPHRSFDYIARDEMGYSDAIHEKLLPYTDRDDFQRLIIRASGDDNYPGIDSSAHMRDMFIQTVADKNKLNVDLRRAERCVVYINGGFWGVYSMREKATDHDYTKYYYDQDKYNLHYLMNWGGTWAEYGGQDAFDDWDALHNYTMSHDMAEPEYYNYVADNLDITSLVDFVLINSYVVCTDWITWNTAWWRGLSPEGGHKKWGYVLWDEDAIFNHYINYTGVPDETAYASPCYPEDISGWSDPEEHIVLLNKLKDNPEFYQYYVSRYADLHNTAFKKEDLLDLVDEIKNQISYDMHKQIDRWGGNHNEWEQNVQKIKDFISVRDSVFSAGLHDCYDLTGPYNITINVVPDSVGEVKVNSITPTEYPWQGAYFGGIETKLKANSTSVFYKFDYWELNNHIITPDSNAVEGIISLTQGDSIVAHFTEVTFSDSLVINEINYKSSSGFDVGDWIEFYNPMPYDLNISDWYFKDKNDDNSFIFPEGTVIETDGYLVLVKDSTAFETLFPDVENFIGEMSFKLSGSGELTRLFNAEGTQVDYVEYDDEYPWPTEPDGDGPTLELIDPELDNALPESWKASFTEHGTPGAQNSTYVDVEEIVVSKILAMSVYPNPFSASTVVRLDPEVKIENGVLDIYNLYGELVKHIDHINSNRVVIMRENLTKGMYICTFHDYASKRYGRVKLIVH